MSSKYRLALLGLSLLALGLLPACPRSGGGGASGPVTLPVPSDFPTSGTICSPINYSFQTPATITGATLPPWLQINGQTISGTPKGNDFGTFTVSVQGQHRGRTGSVSATIKIPPPTIAVTGGPFDILLTGAPTSNAVTVTLSPACSCTVSLTKRDWTGNIIQLPNPPELSLPMAGTASLQIAVETDVPGDGAVILRIVPTGADASPVVTEIAVHAHN